MNLRDRNNIYESGFGPATLFLLHGYGCDQSMWRVLRPHFEQRYKIVTYDHVGAGGSDLAAYDVSKYASLNGYAADLVEIIREYAEGPAVVVGHSVSAMIGMLADFQAPGLVSGHCMLSPSPCYINDGSYRGGFNPEDIDSLLEALETDYTGWASAMAPVLVGATQPAELAKVLESSLCRTDPAIAKQFAQATFFADYRRQLPSLRTPSLVVQCDEDALAPVSVGEYMAEVLPDCMLRVIYNVGHCPHLTQPVLTAGAIDDFLAQQGL